MPTHVGQRLVIYLALAVTMAVQLGCSKKPIPNDELVIGISSQPATLDPRFATDAYGMRIGHLIFHSLVRIGPQLQIVPDAAEKWSYKDRTYTFELQPGLKFHNGRPVTADDLLFSYDQFRSSKSPFASSFDLVEKFEAFNVGDHLRVTIKMKHFVSNFLGASLPVLKILPKADIDKFPNELIGSGSYRFVSQTDGEIRLAANPDARIRPKIPNLIFKVVRDDLTRYQKLLKGELDLLVSELAPDKVGVFEKRPDEFKVYRFPSASMNYMLINMRDPALSNRELRRALSQAINRSEFIRYKLEGLGQEATSILPRNHPFFNAELKNPDYNLEEAKRTVQQLGLTGHRLVFKTSNNPTSIDHAQVLAYELSQTGLNVELESYEWGKFYDDIKKGNFQLTIMKWVPVLDPSIYRDAFHSSETPPGRNRGFYRNPELDVLLDRAIATESDSERKTLYLKIQRIVFDDYAILPLWYDMHVAVLRKNVQGFEPSQGGDYDPLLRVWKLDSSPDLRAAGPN